MGVLVIASINGGNNMLAKLERAYLGLLRVVILVAATIALLVAIIGVATAIPSLLKWSGFTERAEPSGGTLGDFIAEQKITDTTSTTETKEAEPFVIPDIKEAAKTIKAYLSTRGDITQNDWERGLQAYADEMPGNGVDYARSVRTLAKELRSSTGKPLSEARVLQLIEWHKTRFQGDVASRAASEAEGNAQFWIKIGFASAAFLGFVLIIFIFLFVKIERSLRVVQTARVNDSFGVADA
ncbi:hypothetical protein CA236_00130 [Sphingomonas sp. ABOLG]|uniref:hypothetical protein n=1 Tax=Sphingomonas sp. ABOLG TaxID=1985880 RepID=UPI000F7F1C5F|nr:hypothetical protein [Sphingomonas sp. ABOLG]RSV20361.1 hypothetical protein CA236_00130 [Sphingomonas sp. ABOLG]